MRVSPGISFASGRIWLSWQSCSTDIPNRRAIADSVSPRRTTCTAGFAAGRGDPVLAGAAAPERVASAVRTGIFSRCPALSALDFPSLFAALSSATETP